MPNRKQNKKQRKRKRTLPTTEQPHEHARPHLAPIDSSITEVSCNAVSSVPLTELQTFFSNDSVTQSQESHLVALDGIRLNQNLFSRNGKANKYNQQSLVNDAQQGIVNTEADKTLLSVIESADLDQAITLLKGDISFSQNMLDRALISACHHGLKILVQTLLRLRADVQFTDTYGNTPLLISAGNGFVDIVRFLLKMKADVNAFNSVGDTALILSIKASGSSEMVKVLLEQKKIDINHQNKNGYTALMKAIEVRDVDVIKVLMDIKPSMDRYIRLNVVNIYSPVNEHGSLEQTFSSREMKEKEIAEKCGLGNIYQIFKSQQRSQNSSLMVTVDTHDIESLNMLLDCQFVEKRDIHDAFKKIFQKCDLEEVKKISKNETVMIKRLLECGADVIDTGWYNGSSPLSIAVKTGDYSLVEMLCQHLDQQQQLQHHYKTGTGALKEAVKLDRCDLIELLLKYNSDINNDYDYCDSPLNHALICGHFESAELLIKHGAKMNIRSALQSAVTEQLPEYMKFLLNNYQSDVITYATEGESNFNKLLVSATKGGNLEIISNLLDVGADINHGTISREIPLVESKDGNVARFLISKGASVSCKMYGGNSPLLMILDERYKYVHSDRKYKYTSSDIEVVKVLLENGASVNERQRIGKTPIMIAASKEGSMEMLQILLDHGADFNDQDDEGNTALICAVSEKCTENVSFLLHFAKRKNFGLNVQNNKGLSAVMCAATSDGPKMLRELVDYSADVNIKDVSGNTALLNLVKKSSPSVEILTNLTSAGSDVNCQNNDGLSPLMLAARSCHEEIILLLLNSGADVNAVSKRDATKTAISFLPTKWYLRKYEKSCLQALLRGGASSSYINPGVLHELIIRNEFDIIFQLIRCGLRPMDVKAESSLLKLSDSEICHVSPLCVTLLVGNVSLARCFLENLFLTNSDVTTLTGNKSLRCVLERKHHKDCLNILDEMSSQPLSLMKLVLVAVSSAIGTYPGRENRVNLLPLPQIMKNKLLFKSEDVQLSIPMDNIAPCLNEDEERDFLSLFQFVTNHVDDFDYFYADNISSDDDYDAYSFYGSDTD